MSNITTLDDILNLTSPKPAQAKGHSLTTTAQVQTSWKEIALIAIRTVHECNCGATTAHLEPDLFLYLQHKRIGIRHLKRSGPLARAKSKLPFQIKTHTIRATVCDHCVSKYHRPKKQEN